MGTPTGRAVIAAAVLGSGMTLLDGTVVNVALRTIGEDLDASLAQLQWITNGYLLSLASLILLGGSLGDRFGRRRVFVVGTIWFAGASLLCGLAPTPEVLIVARILQGVGAALLTPGSLSMIQGVFHHDDRPAAIGAWSGLGSIAAAIGPFVGGILVEYASWRWIFLINLPMAVATIVIAQKYVPETRDPNPPDHFDYLGAATASLALGGVTYALIEWGGRLAPWAAVAGVIAGVAFVVAERRERQPMLPLGMFRSRTFSAANVMTLLVYAALGAILFFLVLQLQTVGGYGALAAGLATLPITLCMLFLASRGGALGARIGPRIPMTFGPIVMAIGVIMLLGVGDDVSYVEGRPPGPHRLRSGPRPHGRLAHRDRAGRRPRRARRHRVGRQQRGGPGRLAAGGRGAAGRGRPRRRRVRRPAGVRRGVRLGDDHLRRAAADRWRHLVVRDPAHGAGGLRHGAAAPGLPVGPPSRLGP